MTSIERPLRIAWFGEARDGGGVPGMGALLLDGLLHKGVTIDWYTSADESSTPARLVGRAEFTAIRDKSRWQWNRWYSRKPILAFISSTIARRRAYNRLCNRLLHEHRRRPYDVIYQLSQTELFSMGKHRDELPPIVIYPCTHAAGELRWHRRESAYALQSENYLMHYMVRAFLVFRAWFQKKELRKPKLILGPSLRFVQLLAEDYGIDPSRLKVLRHPVILNDAVGTDAAPSHNDPLRLLFISRISVRKGFDQVVELSHRLNDLRGKVEIQIIGDRTMWSNYLGHIGSLNPNIARYLGNVAHDKMSAVYQSADALVVPSKYEPGSLVVGEALEHGLPILASREVGPTEVLSSDICRTFPAGDVAGLERETRALLQELRNNGSRLRHLAIDEAKTHFAPDKICGVLLELLRQAADRSSPD